LKNIASSGVAYEHKYSLPAAVMDAIKPVFRDLASVDLLNRSRMDFHITSVQGSLEISFDRVF
jgi:hypothetical protein